MEAYLRVVNVWVWLLRTALSQPMDNVLSAARSGFVSIPPLNATANLSISKPVRPLWEISSGVLQSLMEKETVSPRKLQSVEIKIVNV